ncbi:MAG: hypothetical protein ACTHN5_14315 [Phycisphaerae bacterium]
MSESSGKIRGIVTALVIIAAAVFLYIWRTGGVHASNGNGWFVDEETGEEMTMPQKMIPPLPGKSGKMTVVREFKYSDDGGKTYKVAYWYKYTDEMKKQLEDAIAAGHEGDVETAPGELVRLPTKGSEWVPLGSDKGQQISHVDIPAGKEKDFLVAIP